MKNLIAWCLRRPVTVVAGCIFVVVLASVAYVRLPVALLPDLRYPSLAVWTAYADVPPERVERTVTQRVEEAVSGTQGLRRATSRSQLGGSLVQLDFGWNVNLDLALLDVREQIDRLGDALPDDVERPVVLRLDPSDRPIMMVALRQTGPRELTPVSERGPPQDALAPRPTLEAPQDLVALKRLGQEVVSRRLEQLSDVARVRVTGGHEPEVDVRINMERMNAHSVSINQVRQSLQAANVALPGGVIRRGPFRYAVEVSGEFESIDDIAATVVARTGQTPLRLRDVATVREGVAERRGLVRLDGAETLLLLIERRPDANTVRAAERVRATLEELQAELSGVQLDVVVDESAFIEEAIGGVTQAVWLGGLLAIVVLFAFLRRPRALIAVAVAVPLSLALTLALFDLLEVTFNLISLSGLALGVGLLVDNAIVVVENIARLREEGRSPLDAARDGTAEVAGAITASTLTTISVFLPLTLVEGLAGRLFRDQSLAVVCSLLASLLVALTVVPLIASREKAPATDTQEPAPKERLGRVMALYERMLTWSLDHRGAVMGGALAVLVGAGALGYVLPREVVPPTDQGRVEVALSLPSDADLPLVDARAAAVDRRIRQLGGVRHVLADLGERDEARLELDPRPPYEGNLTLLLEAGQRADAMLERLRTLAVPGDVQVEARSIPTQLEQLLTTEEAALIIDLVADERRDAERFADEMVTRLRGEDALANVRRADARSLPAYRLTFDRDRLARHRVDVRTVAAYLEAGARGRQATELRTINEEIPIVMRSAGQGSIERLLSQRIPTDAGPLPLNVFVQAEAVELPSALIREGQTPVVRLLADLPTDGDLAAAERVTQAAFADVLPAQVRGRVGGATDAFQDSLRAVLLSLLISLLLVYLILAAQFEHLLQPFAILMAVPLAAAGVALVLYLTQQTVNLMSLTGCVVLVGIVVNDAIIKVDFINQRRALGMPMREAVLAAGRDRLRPILMTTVTTVLGLLPLAIGLGVGAELRAPLAIAIVGGLLSATVLTLIVVPVLYTFLAPRRRSLV